MITIIILAILGWSCSGTQDEGEKKLVKPIEAEVETKQLISKEDNSSAQFPAQSGLQHRPSGDIVISEVKAEQPKDDQIGSPEVFPFNSSRLGETRSTNSTEGRVAIDKIPLFEDSTGINAIDAKINHGTFSSLLTAYVDAQGKVNYEGLKRELPKLDAYLSELEKKTVAEDWSRSEKLAYWINTYNAFTIKLILNHYPVQSITNIAGGKPWDEKWITLGSRTYSLNQIENDIIRPQFNEPRIHFAVNCAARSCPPLANKAFTPTNLESLLEIQTKAFINNQKYNQITADRIQISKIFDWYGSDFKDLVSFLNKYSVVAINADAKIEFSDYDWSLNN